MSVEVDFFPPSPRVIYERTPLTQVICQLRFPQILRIESQPPADFQDRIRRRFPLVERATDATADISPVLLQAVGIVRTSPDFVFRAEDGQTKVTLGSQQIALTTNSYRRWEEFVDLFEYSFRALIETYEPSFFQRIGLRYINTIQRSALGIDDSSWSTLLRKDILGELALPQFENNAIELKRNIRVRMPSHGGGMLLQHGFAKKKGTEETLYRLDFDFYRDMKTEVADARSTLDKFNVMAGRAFRWCITDSLHESLRPTLLELANTG